MKPAILLLAIVAAATTACDRREDVQDASRSTDTTMVPGTDTSTDPEAAMDQAARSTNPELGSRSTDPTRTEEGVEREYPTDATPAPPAPPSE